MAEHNKSKQKRSRAADDIMHSLRRLPKRLKARRRWSSGLLCARSTFPSPANIPPPLSKNFEPGLE